MFKGFDFLQGVSLDRDLPVLDAGQFSLAVDPGHDRVGIESKGRGLNSDFVQSGVYGGLGAAYHPGPVVENGHRLDIGRHSCGQDRAGADLGKQEDERDRKDALHSRLPGLKKTTVQWI